MKKVILLLAFMPLPAFCQISENFESGTISGWIQFPADRWEAAGSPALSGNYSLHHAWDNTEAGCDRAGIPLRNLRPDLGAAKWSFLVRHGYEPSSSNNWAFFLMSDNGPAEMLPGGNISGFAVGVNLAGYDDSLRLWKVKNGSVTPAGTAALNWQTAVGTAMAVRIEVERFISGSWTIRVTFADGTVTGNAEIKESELFHAGWAGISYRYTSTRDRLLWIDDVSVDGVFVEDTIPPAVKSITQRGKNSLMITLDEEADEQFEGLSNFILNGNSSNISAVARDGPVSYILTFTGGLINKKENMMTIARLCDKAGNCRESQSVDFTPAWAEPGDISITEIMADPLPPVSLPAAEYLEIRNNTGFLFDLTGWKLVADGVAASFPGSSIRAGEYLILCNTSDTLSFQGYGRTLGIKSFPVLNDGGKCLIITDESGEMIHGVEYTPEWYGDVLKSEGGWSLEMVDLACPFNTDDNWKGSVSRTGGTPGRVNSVNGFNPDIHFRGIENLFPQSDSSVLITFSEPVSNIAGKADDVTVGGTPASRLIQADLMKRKFIAVTGNTLEQGSIYQLVVPASVADFSGNLIGKRRMDFAFPETAEKGDVVFNELMFNPLPGMPDFIELVNNSDRTFDASMLMLVSVDDKTGDTSSAVFLSLEARCILPGAFYTVTTDSKALAEVYSSSADSFIFELSQLPSMPDNGGHLVLFNRQLDLIDEVRYSAKMHFQLLSGTEGISLEKIRPGLSSMIAGSWHSASESSGWATPGAPNSLLSDPPAEANAVHFSSTRITPDNDGYEDQLSIEFNLSGLDNIVSADIFDESGMLVKVLAGNILSGPRGAIIWDGTLDDGILAQNGIYIIYVTMTDSEGGKQQWKKVCSVLRRQ